MGRGRPARAMSLERPALPGLPMRVCLLVATGTIGRATLAALRRRGHEVVCSATGGRPKGTGGRGGSPTSPTGPARPRGFRGERFDAVVSCMASRTGAPADAWAIDHRAQLNALEAAQAAGVGHFVLLSAICVQKPLLAFQHAKLAFEAALAGSGMRYSIVRPTAFFKSLSGQLERVRRGKPFLVFGDGRLTACKPISDADLARLPGRLPRRRGALEPDPADRRAGAGHHTAPAGGALFALLGQKPPDPATCRSGCSTPSPGGWRRWAVCRRRCADKAELARTGRYYATELMLVWDAGAGRYDAGATPSTGSETLIDWYRGLVEGHVSLERGAHAVF